MKTPQPIFLTVLGDLADVIDSLSLLFPALAGSFVVVYATVWGARQPPAVRAHLLAVVRALWLRK